MAVKPPKRAARGREEDELLIYMTISGNTPVTSSEYTHLTAQMAQQFYKSPGSLTSAVRTTADWLNQFLLKRNLGSTTKGQYLVGRLILGVLRGSQCLFAQCGPTYIFQLTGSETRVLHDPQIAGHGLGIAQTTPLYLSQAELHANDLLVLCPDMPQGWDTALLGERNLSPDLLQRKLAGLNSEDLNAVMVQTRAGRGNILVLRSETPPAHRVVPVAVAAPAAKPKVEDSPVRPTAQVSSEQPASRFTRLVSGGPTTPVQPQPEEPAETEPERVAHPPLISRPQSSTRGGGTRFVTSRSSGDLPEIRRSVSPQRQATYRGLAKMIAGMRSFFQKIGVAVGKFLPHMLPGAQVEGETGNSGMALLAIVVPVVIVAIAATVYVQYGRTTQFNSNFAMAVSQADLARGQGDPTEVRRAWDSTIYYLDQAEKSLRNQPQAVALRQEAQTALDNLDGILRLDFHTAIPGGLSHTIQVSQIAATDTDLYLLDGARGDVIRATLVDNGYEVDNAFKCAPGSYDNVVVGKLIGIVALPMTNIYNARVMGMDDKGTLIYCGLADPKAVSLVAPQLGWNKITAFTLDADGKNLYVLDPGTNAVWQYAGNYGQFTDLPIMFFGEQVPQNMSTAIDLAANNSDMYLLFQDGHVTSCPLTRFTGVPMRCSDPATFKDNRPERQSGAKINDAIFTQLTFASAPDPSLYMLEPLTHAVYRFSPRSDSLELRGQFRATLEEEQNSALASGPATAVTIGPNRYIFIGVGSQVFFATDVP